MSFNKQNNDPVRDLRNLLLSKSDWTQLEDAPISEQLKDAYKVYRQALRDLPQTVDLNNIAFPEEPR